MILIINNYLPTVTIISLSHNKPNITISLYFGRNFVKKMNTVLEKFLWVTREENKTQQGKATRSRSRG